MTERLYLRSDGISETPSGIFAVMSKQYTGDDGTTRYFEFRAHALAPRTRIEWPSETDLVMLPQGEAGAMVRFGYARYLTQGEVDEYNALLDEKEPPVISAPTIDPAAPAPIVSPEPPKTPPAPPLSPPAPIPEPVAMPEPGKAT